MLVVVLRSVFADLKKTANGRVHGIADRCAPYVRVWSCAHAVRWDPVHGEHVCKRFQDPIYSHRVADHHGGDNNARRPVPRAVARAGKSRLAAATVLALRTACPPPFPRISSWSLRTSPPRYRYIQNKCLSLVCASCRYLVSIHTPNTFHHHRLAYHRSTR